MISIKNSYIPLIVSLVVFLTSMQAISQPLDSISGKYYMDGDSGRVIEISQSYDNVYCIGEETSPWPWAGTVTLDGNRLSGTGRFKNSEAIISLDGVVKGDGSIAIDYTWTNTEDRGRKDQHVLYRSQQGSISGKYYMDGDSGRVIEISQSYDNVYSIGEETSPWPWAGTATLDGNRLLGTGRFKNSEAIISLDGVVKGDGSIAIDYTWTNTEDRGRKDQHVLYRAS